MGAHHDPVQRAVVCALGVVGTLLDGTLDALVGVHNELPPLIWCKASMDRLSRVYTGNFTLILLIAFFSIICYHISRKIILWRNFI